MRLLLIAIVALALGTPSAGCKADQAVEGAAAKVGPKPIGNAECASCTMVVREQPAPRGQLVHRDGTHLHFCSVDDMVQYLHSPSKHGEAVEIYTEVMPPAHAPSDMSTEERTWTAAESVHFVLGVKRQGVMGPPVMSYQTRAAATAAGTEHQGHVVTWQQLRKEK